MPHKPTLFNLRHKLSLANDAIERNYTKLLFVQSLRASIVNQIDTILLHQPPHAKLYTEFETATRIFESNYWTNILDFHTRHNSSEITIAQIALLEADIYHFDETVERIPPDRSDFSLYYVYPSPPSSPDHI